MFERARRRLTIAYVALFAALLVIFSVAFFALVVTVIQPNFDLTPGTESDEVAQVAVDDAIQRIAISLVVADLITIGLVSVGAWLLASRTLGPIRAAHDRQRRFVADASHQMRTPLTVIRSSAEAALSDSATDADRRAALETATRAASEMSDMTADLLALAQANDSMGSVSTERCDLSVAVAERLALRAAAPGPRPAVALAEDLEVEVAADDIARIVDILVDNAYRHGGDDVAVRLTTSETNGRAQLEVADDGPGINADDLPHVFEPFFRVHSDATAVPGTGLGLAIAVDLATRNRGQLTVESAPGRGATFRLLLPLRR